MAEIVRAAMGVLLLWACAAVLAQTLSDPTRPAPEAAPTASASQSEPAVDPQTGLRVVVTARDGSYALVNGERLRVGSRFGEMVIVAIEPTALVLRDAKGRVQRVNLFPALNAQQP